MKFRALSTTQSGYSYIYPSALRGAPNSKVKIKVESGAGQIRELELTRNVVLETVQFPVVRRFTCPLAL